MAPAKKTKKVAAADEAAPEATADESTEAETPEEEDAPAKKPAKKAEAKGDGPIRVTLPDGSSRVYSRATHGAVYKTLAENYAEAHDGELS